MGESSAKLGAVLALMGLNGLQQRVVRRLRLWPMSPSTIWDVFRELQLDRAIAKPSAARHLVEEVRSRSIRESDWSNEWPRAGKATRVRLHGALSRAASSSELGAHKAWMLVDALAKIPNPSLAPDGPTVSSVLYFRDIYIYI